MSDLATESPQEENASWSSTLDGWIGGASRPRRWYGPAAVLLFLSVAIASALRLPPLEVRPGWLAAAVAALLGSILLLGAEYRLSAWLVERRVTWIDALRVTIMASAANLLPVPGGLAVRTGALRGMGSKWSTAFGSNIIMGLGWLGVALLLAGILLARQASVPVVAGLLASGVLVVSAMCVAVKRIVGNRNPVSSAGLVLLVETLYVMVSALRLYAILHGLGIEIDFAQATGLTVASALAAGIGLAPGGLGLRELLAGGLAPLIGLAPAIGAFAGVIDRLLGLVVRGVLAAVLWRSIAGSGSTGEAGDEGSP